MIFLATNCYMTDLRFMYPARYTADKGGADAVRQAAVARWDEEWRILSETLGEGPFFLGEAVSALDIYAAMIATWSLDSPAFFKRFANVERHYRRVAAVPAIAAVWARNGMPI
jgi:glutathione S-transferase